MMLIPHCSCEIPIKALGFAFKPLIGLLSLVQGPFESLRTAGFAYV